MEDAARSLLAVDAPVCGRAFRPSLGGLLAVVGCWVHRGSLGSLAVLVPVAVGAGVPGPAGLWVLRGQALGFLRVGGGLPPRRCVGTVTVYCGAACARALAVVAAARRIARRTSWSLRLAAMAAASAAALS